MKPRRIARRDFGDLDPNEIAFGHLMKEAGYKTCVAGKWQLCGGSRHKGAFPKPSGFDESCMWTYSRDLPEAARPRSPSFHLYSNAKIRKYNAKNWP